jgi:hypothetical protein
MLTIDPVNNITFYNGQTIEMVYLRPIGGSPFDSWNGFPWLSDGYWHVTSIL